MAKRKITGGASFIGIAFTLSIILDFIFTYIFKTQSSSVDMVYYFASYPIYLLTLILSSIIIPSSIVKSLSAYIAKNDFLTISKTIKNLLKYFFIIGALLAIINLLLSSPYSNLISMPEASKPLQYMGISLFLGLIISVYRGYLQSFNLYTISWISQIAISVLKIIITFILMLVFKNSTNASLSSMPNIMSLAFLIAQAIMAIFLSLIFIRHNNSLKGHYSHNSPKYNYTKLSIKILLASLLNALPFCLFALISSLDFIFFKMVFSKIFDPFDVSSSLNTFSLLYSDAYQPILLCALICFGFAVACSSGIITLRAKKQLDMMKHSINTLIKSIFVFSLLFCVILFVLKDPFAVIISSKDTMPVVSDIISVLSLCCIFLSLSLCGTLILQSIGRNFIAIFTSVIAVVFKITILLILNNINKMGIQTFIFSSLAAYMASGLLNIMYSVRLSKCNINIGESFLKPLFASLITGVVIYFAYSKLFLQLMNEVQGGIISALTGIILYVATIAVLNVYKFDDLSYIPIINNLSKK